MAEKRGYKVTNFDTIIEELNELLCKQQPPKITSSWIVENAPRIYHFFWKNVRSDIGDIDWDKIVSHLDKELQKKWSGNRSRTKRQWQALKWYRNRKEVNLVLKKYKGKLYTFLSPQDYEDRKIRNAISIALVRITQKGNLYAKQEILSLLRYTVEYWIEWIPGLSPWKGYESEIEEQLESCIRRYRFTGSFMTYLFCSLEYRGRGLRRLCSYSLDDVMPLGEKRRVENVVQDSETNQISFYKPY
ncbi:MAG: hypothetical protein WAW00_02850 [Candidatus Moraniibacteriota bacterium]